MTVDQRLIDLAVQLAEDREQPVADVPVAAIARAAGISRSTLLRRLGGSRSALDDAIRATGADPGGRTPLSDRLVEAAANLIADRGLGSVTLAAVAEDAGCSLPALHGAFDGRDHLLAAVFDRYSPLRDLNELATDPPAELDRVVRRVYGAFGTALSREPRVVPALLADLFARPNGPAAELLRANLPRILHTVTDLLGPHQRSGILRPIPVPLLIQLLVAPMVMHLVLRPSLEQTIPLPSIEQTTDTFTTAFLAAATSVDHPIRS